MCPGAVVHLLLFLKVYIESRRAEVETFPSGEVDVSFLRFLESYSQGCNTG